MGKLYHTQKNKKIVYHYCSLDTLLNILQNKTIRLSDINKLNDSNESKALLHITRNRSIQMVLEQEKKNRTRMAGLSYREFIVYLIDRMIAQVQDYHDLLTYIACFSESADYLGQWRGYGDNGKGVAIGFDVQAIGKLVSTIPMGQMEFRKVNYIDSRQDMIDCGSESCDVSISIHARELIETLFEYMDNNQTDQILSGEYMASEHAQWFIPLLQDSFFYKDSSFAEENEWRLILKDEIIKSEENWQTIYNWKRTEHGSPNHLERLFPDALQFRVMGNDIISYLDMDFSGGNHTHNDMIQEIMIGPNCRLKPSDVFQMLGHFGFDTSNVTVRKSNSPYRILI